MEYLIALIYIIIGMVGGTGHYLKKRYIDGTTKDSFIEYFKGDLKSTKMTAITIFFTEIGLSLASGGLTSGGFLSLGDIFGALTAGYMVDSGLNKPSDYGNYRYHEDMSDDGDEPTYHEKPDSYR